MSGDMLADKEREDLIVYLQLMNRHSGHELMYGPVEMPKAKLAEGTGILGMRCDTCDMLVTFIQVPVWMLDDILAGTIRRNMTGELPKS